MQEVTVIDAAKAERHYWLDLCANTLFQMLAWRAICGGHIRAASADIPKVVHSDFGAYELYRGWPWRFVYCDWLNV